MKVEDFAHQVSLRTMALLTELNHYKISEDLQKEVLKRVRGEVNQLIRQSSK
jgi:hypothetical protein